MPAILYHWLNVEIFSGGKKLANCELFDKIFLANSHGYAENAFGICTDCSLFANFFLTSNFYLYGLPKFPPAKFYHDIVISLYIVASLMYVCVCLCTCVCVCICVYVYVLDLCMCVLLTVNKEILNSMVEYRTVGDL